MKKLVAILSSAAIALGSYAAPFASSAAALSIAPKFQPGDLIRGASFPAVYYYGQDGFRYVFANDKTYFTWYSDFSQVKKVSDAELSAIQIGGNVTYKPGVKMIKINTDPKTYAIGAGGTLRWITSEAAAVALYGSNWNKQIDDVPDAFFRNYKQGGADIAVAADFNKANEMAAATDISRDKDLRAPKLVMIENNKFSEDTITINAGTAVKFLNTEMGGMNHTATADDLSWGTGTLKSGESFTRYFKTAGTYTYFCSIHPSMRGTIVVQ